MCAILHAGARASVYCATSPDAPSEGSATGGYFDANCRPLMPSRAAQVMICRGCRWFLRYTTESIACVQLCSGPDMHAVAVLQTSTHPSRAISKHGEHSGATSPATAVSHCSHITPRCLPARPPACQAHLDPTPSTPLCLPSRAGPGCGAVGVALVRAAGGPAQGPGPA